MLWPVHVLCKDDMFELSNICSGGWVNIFFQNFMNEYHFKMCMHFSRVKIVHNTCQQNQGHLKDGSVPEGDHPQVVVLRLQNGLEHLEKSDLSLLQNYFLI